MIIEAFLELRDLEIKASLEDEEMEVEIKLEKDLDIQCWLEPQLEITANFKEKYELEG